MKSRGCVGQDDAGNYRLQGKWTWFHANGQKKAEGAFKHGFAGGEKGDTGIPLNGRHGLWIEWHENGQKKSEGTF